MKVSRLLLQQLTSRDAAVIAEEIFSLYDELVRNEWRTGVA
jgi:hypothetical protein